MPEKKYFYAAIAVVFLTIFTSLAIFDLLPDTVATHWNINGEADGFSDKAFYVTIFPAIAIVLLGLFFILPRIDPKRDRYKHFIVEYTLFILIFTLFNYYIYLVTILLAFGFVIRLDIAFAFAFAVLFYFIGRLMSKAKQNFFVGIRTPWTLSDQEVWDEIHKLASKFFKLAAGLIFISGIASYYTGINSFYPMIFLAVVPAIFLVFYSYILYQKKHKK